jgi:hypothetical protein
VDRTSDKPFHYPFTISLFVYARLDSEEVAKPKAIDVSKDPFLLIDTLNSLLGWWDTGVEWYHKNILNSVTKVTNHVALISARLSSALVDANRILESPLTLSKQLIDSGLDLASKIRDQYEDGKLTIGDYSELLEVAHTQLRDSLSMYGFSIAEGAQESKEEVVPLDKGYNVDNSNKDIRYNTYEFNSVILYTVSGGDTLQSIALNLLGDEELWPYVAVVNSDINDNDDLVIGERIYVPISISQRTSKDRFILSEDASRDPYGADIKIGDDGEIVLRESNDVSLISGVENVKQAVNLRLNTLVGSMIKQTAFGLSTQPGLAGTELAEKYVRMGLKSSLVQDPRISSVDNVHVVVLKDSVTASMDIKIVGYDKTLPIDVIIG